MRIVAWVVCEKYIHGLALWLARSTWIYTSLRAVGCSELSVCRNLKKWEFECCNFTKFLWRSITERLVEFKFQCLQDSDMNSRNFQIFWCRFSMYFCWTPKIPKVKLHQKFAKLQYLLKNITKLKRFTGPLQNHNLWSCRLLIRRVRW